MKINPRTLLFAAVAAESSGLGKAAGAPPSQATPPPPAADSAAKRETTRSDVEAHLSPAARKVLQDRLARKAGKTDTSATPTAADDKAKAESEAALAVVPPTAPEKPAATAKPGDAEKPKDEEPESGVIDFSKLTTSAPAAGEDGAPAALTEAELADLGIVRKKLEEAHKDNAAQRKLKRELKEAKEKLEAENKSLSEELEQVRAQAGTKSAGKSYLDKFSTVEDVEAAKADALETLRQLQEQPDRESITLPGNRSWKMLTAEGKSIAAGAAQTAFDILEGYDGKVKQLAERTAAETVVKDHLPKLAKALPDFEKSYKETLASDWTARAPEISLDAALGKLVRTGAYVMVPAGKQAAAKPAAAAPKKDEPKPELPNTPPPVREAKAGEADVSDLKKRAFAGDPKALEQWIKQGGKRSQAA